MEVLPIASSSDGNCTLIRSDGVAILIDCGVGIRAITAEIGRDRWQTLGALFVTHEHTDHISGIPTLARRLPELPVYVHDASFRAKRRYFSDANRKRLRSGWTMTVGPFSVTPFPTHHDAESSHGFTISDSHSGLTLCLIADTGHICPAIKEQAAGADILFIECDYDERMLARYPDYSPDLKARIAGPHGHLSNDQALDLVEELGVEHFRRIIFSHLSPRTNSPEVLLDLVKHRFGTTDRIEVAGRKGIDPTSLLFR